MFLAEKRKNAERIEALTIGAMAARGEKKAIEKFIRDLERA